MPGWAQGAIVALPWLLLLVSALLEWLPATRPVGVALLLEDGPVEWMTFLAALAAGILGLGMARRLGGRGAKWACRFYVLVSLGMLFFAMEEISWTQRITRFRTPVAMEEVNQQGEFNIHNLPILDRLEKYVIVAICVVALLTARAPGQAGRSGLRPPALLASLWLAILTATLVRLASFYLPTNETQEIVLDDQVEMVEFLLASGVLFYVVLNRRTLGKGTPASTA